MLFEIIIIMGCPDCVNHCSEYLAYLIKRYNRSR